MKKVAIYTRVSTDEQARLGTSLAHQKDVLESYCDREGLQVVGFYEDDGFSGSDVHRPALQSLMRDAAQKKFDAVLVYRLDRFSRSLADAPHLILRDFNQNGIAFKSLTEHFDTETPHGKIMLGMLSGFADFERDRIRERSREGKLRKAAQGCWIQSFTPFGYARDKDKKLIADEKEAKIYRQMTEWCMSGESTLQIARKLNAFGVPTKHTVWSKKGRVFIWKAGTIYGILRKSHYWRGKIENWGSSIVCPPLISREGWDGIQSQLTRNYNNSKRHTKRFYLLRGLLQCAKCSRNLFGLIKENRGMRVYCCLSKRADPDPRFCGLKNVPIAKLDAIVWETVSAMVKNSEKVSRAIEQTRMQQSADSVTLEAELKFLEKKAIEKSQEVNCIMELYTKSKSLSIIEMDEQIKKVKMEREVIVDELVKVRKSLAEMQHTRVDPQMVGTWAKFVAGRVDAMTPEERRELLLSVVGKIIVDWEAVEKRHSVQIQYAIPIFDSEPTGGKETSYHLLHQHL